MPELIQLKIAKTQVKPQNNSVLCYSFLTAGWLSSGGICLKIHLPSWAVLAATLQGTGSSSVTSCHCPASVTQFPKALESFQFITQSFKNMKFSELQEKYWRNKFAHLSWKGSCGIIAPLEQLLVKLLYKISDFSTFPDVVVLTFSPSNFWNFYWWKGAESSEGKGFVGNGHSHKDLLDTIPMCNVWIFFLNCFILPLTEESKNCLFLFKILSTTHPTYTNCTWSKLKQNRDTNFQKIQKNRSEGWGLQFSSSGLCRTPLSFPPHKLQQDQSTKFSASSPDGLSTKSSSEVKFSSLTNEKSFTEAFQSSSTCFSGSLLLTYAQLRDL